MNLTIDVLKEAMAKLPPRPANVVEVRYGNGQMAMELPTADITRFVVAGLIEWDEGSHAFYMTLRAEQFLRPR